MLHCIYYVVILNVLEESKANLWPKCLTDLYTEE